ncbi:hypothetical protein [Methanotorris igneus]|uniref:Uncharacterized protein n=1 Tax=Methanotorris igneus (strain DSM 5666 / JCM 11834 / Kol 5) TaxID=880724 RepID=F6BBZ2_METIK|nr:hypothetical protein [Methanotorris igneus]AEF96073.1 hypothetical protein Metig_0517 [Methanotorris igneus Kol 5]
MDATFAGSTIPNITNRPQLYEWLERNMERSYKDILDDTKLEPEQNVVKTYILESNTHPKKLSRIIKTGKIELLDEYEFYMLRIGDEGYFFIDAKNPRFWKLYTLQKSEESDKYFNKLISPIKSRLDNLWMPTGDLEKFLKKADYVRGLSTKHDETPFYLDNGVEEIANKLSISGNGESVYKLIEIIQSLSPDDIQEFEKLIEDFQLSNDTKIKKIFNTIKKLHEFKHLMRITKSKIKIVSEDDKDKFVLEDIYYWGKFTVKGTSIEKHNEIVDETIENYEQKIEIIEDSLIDYTSSDWDDRIPLIYEFEKEIEDLKSFVEGLISVKEPFRIWGLAKQVEEDMYYISGVDLHNGDRFSLEVTPWWMRLYLPKGSCGNTALRLLSNIQQTYDSETILEVEKHGERIR